MPKNEKQDVPGLGNLILGYGLLGLQPIPVSMLAKLNVGAAETVLARFVIGSAAILVICLTRGRGLRTEQPKILLFRGLLGGAAVLLYFVSIQEAGAARGTLLNYTYPIWANLFGALFGERPGKLFWAGLITALVGVWFVVVPSVDLAQEGIGGGELAGIMSAVFAGGAVITIKRLRRTDESLTIIAAFSGCGLLMSFPFTDPRSLGLLFHSKAALLALLVGLIAFCGHLFFTRGYRGVSVAHATLLSLLVPVIAAFAGIFALDEPITGRFLFGAFLVLAASGIVLGSQLRKLPIDQSARSAT